MIKKNFCIKSEHIDTLYEAKLVMLFHWIQRTRVQRYYEPLIRLNSTLGNVCRTGDNLN